MITANNYFEEIKPIVSKLPEAVKEAHNLVLAMKKDGIDDPFNTGDPEIDSMGELLLNKANEILSSSEPKSRDRIDFVVNKKKAEPKRDTAIFKKYLWDERHPLMILTKGSSQWNEAYDEFIEYIKTNPKGKQGEFELIETTKKPAAKKAPSKKKAAKKVTAKKTAQKPTKKMRKAVSRKIKQVVKSVRKADAAKPAVTKKIFSKELELVKAFIAIQGKEVAITTLILKRNNLKNALKNDKTNQHQTILENILRRYNKVIDSAKETTTHFKCNIETGFYNTCKNLITNAKIKVRTDVLGGVTKGYRLLSPDGIDIERDTIYKTLDEVETAFNKWKKRYEKQGYYSSNLDRIDLEDLADTMTLIDLKTNDWTIYGEVLNETDEELDLKGIGKGDYSIGEFIAIESEESKGFTYRGKILFGRPVVLKEKNNSPVKKWAVDDLKTANFISEKLNKYAAKK